MFAPARIPVAAGKKTANTVKNDSLLVKFGIVLLRNVAAIVHDNLSEISKLLNLV